MSVQLLNAMPSPFRKFSDKRKEKKARKAAKVAAVSETYPLKDTQTPVMSSLEPSCTEVAQVAETPSFSTVMVNESTSSTTQTTSTAKSDTIQWYGASDLHRAIGTTPMNSIRQHQGITSSQQPSDYTPPAAIPYIPSGVDYSHWDDQRRLEFAAKFNALSPIFDGVDGSVWHKAICSDIVGPTSPSAYRGSVTWGNMNCKPTRGQEGEGEGEIEFASGLNYN